MLLKRKPRLSLTFLASLVLISVCSIAGTLTRQTLSHSPPQFIGITLPDIPAFDIDQKQSKIMYASDSRPTVIYVTMPGCDWCSQNAGVINSVVNARNDQYRFIGLSFNRKGLKELAKAYSTNILFYNNLEQGSIDALKLGEVPQTLVISPQGKLLKKWTGTYAGKQKEEIESYFQVKIPASTDEANSCSYCTHDGNGYSKGAVNKINGRIVTCQSNGHWEAL